MADVVTAWNPFIITNKGLNLRQDAIATGKTVTFNYAKIGQGAPSSPSNVPLLNDLVSPAQQVPVVRSESNGVTHFVGVRIDNAEYTQPVLMREIGLFASVDGDTPVLYGYTYATQGYDSIPAGSVSHYIWTVGIDTVLSRAQSISFTYDGSTVYATFDDIDQLMQSFDEFRTEMIAMGGGIIFSETEPEDEYWSMWIENQGAAEIPGESDTAAKVRLTAKQSDGTPVDVFPETLAEQVICIVPDNSAGGGVGENGTPSTTETALDTVLSEHADAISANAQAITEHAGDLQLLVRPGYADCDTDGNTVEKTVDITPFILEVGGELTINFANANTAPGATLNVANSGAKPLLYKGQPLPAGLLSGIQNVSYDGANWNIVGDLDTNVDTTYDLMSVGEAEAGTSITPRTVNAANFKQIVTDLATSIVDTELADSYDVSGLQASLNNLIFQLAAQGVIDGNGLDTVVTIDAASDIVLLSGIFADGKVYI